MRSRATAHARTLLAAATLGLAALASSNVAQAAVKQAETVLPPGQSGFVSAAGLAEGTGSPHLTDQTSLFTSFRYKSALFGQQGETEMPRAGVRIVRGPYGVPSITGATDFDAWWGVGYAVAQDRLFQLELFRRATSGRLAEILGDGFLPDDLIARRDYYTDGEVDAMLARLPTNLVRRAEAYRDGINAWVAETRSDPTKLPGEFTALGVQPPTWTVRDTARIGVFLARTVPSGDGVELDNLRALRELGARAFARLLPLRAPGRISTVPRKAGLFPSQPGRTVKQERAAYLRSRRALKTTPIPTPVEAATAGRSEALGGSYMWGMNRKAGRGRRIRTKGVDTYLFNGPQLGFSIPELFVEFELHSPVQNIRGVSAAGVPVLGIGHNGRLAWGFTSGLSDEDDLYAEKLTGPETYTFKGSQRQMSCRDERFDYRSPPTDLPDRIGDIIKPGGLAGSRTERICRTVHGPVQAREKGVAFARRYAIWGRELETLVGLSALNDAKTVREADRALLGVTWNENVIATDDRGNIGYWHPGLHPLRPKNYDERLPYPGTGEAEWRGLLPRRKTPHVINPRQGYLLQWNNVPSTGWTSGDGEARERQTGPFHRSGLLKRLVSWLAAKPSYDGSKAVDRRSGTTAQQRPLYGRQLRRARKGSKGKARELLTTLLEWDGTYARADSAGKVDPGVAVWENFKDQAELIAFRRITKAPLTGTGAESLLGKPGTSHEFDISNGEAYALRTLDIRGVRKAAARTHDAMAARFRNPNPDTWREPRRMYEVAAQGAASAPDLPFFDRGTWEQSIHLGR
ncbi:MAG TPA: penicillin acylase family protein [Thermoleophilaceae bacterium]|nr:penicillin acylase family protein [Thermoleophilaceae bacterium]